MSYQPMDPEEIKTVMRDGRIELTEAHFYDMIEERMNGLAEDYEWPFYPADFIASIQEWETFKAAMTRWLSDHDREAREGFAHADAELAEEREQRHLKPVGD